MRIDTQPHLAAINSPIHVLLVEDEYVDAEMTRKKLLRCAPLATIDVAKTTAQAIEKLRTSRYHCVLLDLNLPDSVGPSSIADIRHIDRRTPIIVLTGFAAPITIEEALKAGAQKVLSKNDLSELSLGEALGRYCI